MRECASHTDECFESQGKVPSRRRLAPNRNLIVAGAAFDGLEVTPTLISICDCSVRQSVRRTACRRSRLAVPRSCDVPTPPHELAKDQPMLGCFSDSLRSYC